MSMLQNFLEFNYADPEDRSRNVKLFKNLCVYKKNKKLCIEYMGRYPVISISLKNVDGEDFVKALYSMKSLLNSLFDKFSFLLESDRQNEANSELFRTINIRVAEYPHFSRSGCHQLRNASSADWPAMTSMKKGIFSRRTSNGNVCKPE